jgi:hypothetical protein
LTSRRAYKEIYLYIHALSAFSSRPILLIEGDLLNLNKLRRALVAEKCHEASSRQLDSKTLITPTLSISADKIYFRLFSPFTDVFCFFADDVGKFRPIVERLTL